VQAHSLPSSARLARTLLAWYDRHRRRLPWRAAPGEEADPYRVWLAEIMLQQTTAAAVSPYFAAFLRRWPTVEALAAAPLDAVLTQWAGLGYYARARNLHRCAIEIATGHGGRFPRSEEALARLPGIGPYTAGAIAAIAFGQRAAAVDGNAERVLARLHAIETPLPRAKVELRSLALAMVPRSRPGDFAQALMDLGATLCTVRRPRCMACPWAAHCRARAMGEAERLPVRPPKTGKPVRHGIAFWAVREDGAVLLRRRAEEGLLGGMAEIPSTPWRDRPWTAAEALEDAPLAADWQPLAGAIAHVFTHFRLELAVLAARLPLAATAAGGYWCALDRLSGEPLPSLMRKVVTLGLAGRRQEQGQGALH
jgi:A/G-specific adenine glycosylase